MLASVCAREGHGVDQKQSAYVDLVQGRARSYLPSHPHRQLSAPLLTHGSAAAIIVNRLLPAPRCCCKQLKRWPTGLTHAHSKVVVGRIRRDHLCASTTIGATSARGRGADGPRFDNDRIRRPLWCFLFIDEEAYATLSGLFQSALTFLLMGPSCVTGGSGKPADIAVLRHPAHSRHPAMLFFYQALLPSVACRYFYAEQARKPL